MNKEPWRKINKIKSMLKCAEVPKPAQQSFNLEAHIYVLNIVVKKSSRWLWATTPIFLLRHLYFSSCNNTNTSRSWSSSFTNLLWRSQTFPWSHAAPTQLLRRPQWSVVHFIVICLQLYRDTPNPTVAIVMAMGSMRLLCGGTWTSPDICLCRQDGQGHEGGVLTSSG